MFFCLCVGWGTQPQMASRFASLQMYSMDQVGGQWGAKHVSGYMFSCVDHLLLSSRVETLIKPI